MIPLLSMNWRRLSRSELACAALVFAASFGIYLKTLAPTVTFVDSGELILAARSLGVAHPPGFPFYILLAHAATWLPVGNIAVRVNLFSALAAALAASALALIVAEGSLALRRQKGGEKKNKAAADGLFLPPIVAGLMAATSRTLWSYATITEVYALNALLVLAASLFIVSWRRRVIEGGPEPKRALCFSALAFGLGLGVHHVTAGLMFPALIALILATSGLRPFRGGRALALALCAASGLLVYIYLPIAASRSPAMNWGDPRTLERFWWHVTGRQYQIFFSPSLERMLDQLGEFVRLLVREFGPPWFPAGLALALLGLIWLWRRDRAMFYFLALIIAADLAYGLNYEIAEDKDAYYLPAFMAFSVAAGFGAERLLWLMPRRALAAALLLVPAASLAANLPFCDRSRYFLARDYVYNILSTVREGGLLLTLDWQVYSPMLYVRHIEGARRDVIAVDVNLLRRSWYFDYLGREYPELINQARPEVEAFLEDLRNWEKDPRLYERDVQLNRRINARFYDMILAFVRNHLRSRPVYVTHDVLTQERELAARLSQYEQIPQGLVFEVAEGRYFREPAQPRLEMRGLFDGTMRFDERDVVRLKVAPVYLGMLVNRGRYLMAYGRRERAIELFEEALALDPNYAPARRSLEEAARSMN